LTGILLLLVLHAMYVAAALLIPITLAFLLSVVLSPVVRLLVRLRVPQVVSALLVMMLLASAIVAGVYKLAEPAIAWVERAPEELEALEAKLSWVEEPARELKEAQEQVGMENLMGASQSSFSLVGTLLEGAPNIIFGTAITLILLFFALASGDALLNKAVQVAPSLKDKKRVVETGREIQRHVSAYLGTITIINAGVGLLVGLAMYVLAMPNPILWGVMVAVLNFIPYLGVFISIIVVTFVAMLTFDTAGDMLMPAAAIFAINVVEGQFITPILAGRSLALSPVAVFLSLVVMGWLWGIVGVLMAVPLLAIVRLVCEEIRPLEAIATFLGR
jgi:predicted PurR-regulated permease PerM